MSPTALWGGARSAIALGMSYAPASDPMALAEQGERGRISVYAQGGDYHKTVKKALKALAQMPTVTMAATIAGTSRPNSGSE